MRFSLLFSSTLVVTSRAFFGDLQDVSSGAPVTNQDAPANLENGFKNVVSELNAMHGFMVSSEQSQLRQAQANKALQAQNSQYHSETQRLQQQLQKLQQELQQARQENSNLQTRDAQLGENYQKLSTASKKLAQQYKALNTQESQLQAKNQQEANEISSLKQEKSGLVSALRKFKGIIAAQGQEIAGQLDSAISGSGNTAAVASIPKTEAVPEPVEAPMPALPEPAPLPAAQAPVAPAPMEPLPSLPEAPPVIAAAPMNSNPAPVSAATDQISDIPDMGPLELGPPPAPASKDSKAANQKGRKAPQQSSLEKDLSSLSDVRKADDVPALQAAAGMDPDVSKIAQADDQVLQMARDAGFLPSA